MLCQKQFHGPVIRQARILIRKAVALVPGKEIVDVKAETPTGASDGVGLCLGRADVGVLEDQQRRPQPIKPSQRRSLFQLLAVGFDFGAADKPIS